MAELDVTRLVREADCFEFSASRAERGENAGAETWANAKEEAGDSPLLSAEQLDEARAWFRGFGAWNREELAAMSADELNALLIQFVAGDIREAQSLCPSDNDDGIDWPEYETLASEGTLRGSLFPHEDRVFFTMSR
jgi:hypothetical protein